MTNQYNERSCNCKSSGCNSDWASADNIACYVCDSSDGIECDAEHLGEEVKAIVELTCVYSETCFECYPAILPQAKCWHPMNRGCYISESETHISLFFLLFDVFLLFIAVSEVIHSEFVRSCSDEHEQDGFVCR